MTSKQKTLQQRLREAVEADHNARYPSDMPCYDYLAEDAADKIDELEAEIKKLKQVISLCDICSTNARMYETSEPGILNTSNIQSNSNACGEMPAGTIKLVLDYEEDLKTGDVRIVQR